MKTHKTLFFFIAILVIPCPAAYPVIQEVQSVLDEIHSDTPAEVGNSQPTGSSPPASKPYVMEAGDADVLEQLLAGQSGLGEETSTIETGGGEGGQEEIPEEEISGQQNIPFWRRPSILVSGVLLMGLGILLTVLAAAGEGSSSSGSSGGSSSGSGGDEQEENGPTRDNLTDPPGGGGGGGGGDGGGGDEQNIPSSPEPSTLLLLGSGLGLAFLKKKHKF